MKLPADRTRWLPSDWLRNGWTKHQSNRFSEESLRQNGMHQLITQPESIEGSCLTGAESNWCTWGKTPIHERALRLEEAMYKVAHDEYGSRSVVDINDFTLPSGPVGQAAAIIFMTKCERMAGLRD